MTSYHPVLRPCPIHTVLDVEDPSPGRKNLPRKGIDDRRRNFFPVQEEATPPSTHHASSHRMGRSFGPLPFPPLPNPDPLGFEPGTASVRPSLSTSIVSDTIGENGDGSLEDENTCPPFPRSQPYGKAFLRERIPFRSEKEIPFRRKRRPDPSHPSTETGPKRSFVPEGIKGPGKKISHARSSARISSSHEEDA